MQHGDLISLAEEEKSGTMMRNFIWHLEYKYDYSVSF
jgi:hypothetical protein